MSAYITNIIKNLDALLTKFKIVSTEIKDNNHGYGYLPSGRCNIHTLEDGTKICEGLSFSPSKAATIGYFYHNENDGETRINSYM